MCAACGLAPTLSPRADTCSQCAAAGIVPQRLAATNSPATLALAHAQRPAAESAAAPAPRTTVADAVAAALAASDAEADRPGRYVEPCTDCHRPGPDTLRRWNAEQWRMIADGVLCGACDDEDHQDDEPDTRTTCTHPGCGLLEGPVPLGWYADDRRPTNVTLPAWEAGRAATLAHNAGHPADLEDDAHLATVADTPDLSTFDPYDVEPF
jgi:hypothetical protein